MLPELFHIGPVPIRAYGLMLAVSFLLGVFYIRYISKRDDKPFDEYVNIAYILILGGIIGARLFYVLFHLSEFSGRWLATFNPFHSGSYVGIAGLNLYGGVLVAVGGAWLYCRIKKLPVLEVFDNFAPTLGIGIAVTRIGCFCNGCCFGTPTDLPWGVTFPAGSIPSHIFGAQHIHPAQLYSSAYGVLMFLLLHWMGKNKKFTGQLIAVGFMFEAVFRFLIEQVRYYENAMEFALGSFHPTYNQVISVSLFLFGLAIYIIQSRRSAAHG